MPSSVCTTAPVRSPSSGLDQCGPIAQAHRIVIPVRKAKPHEQAAGRVRPQRVDQLLSQQSHRGRAEDDDALLVEPNDAFIRPKIEQFGELQTVIVHCPQYCVERTAFNAVTRPMEASNGRRFPDDLDRLPEGVRPASIVRSPLSRIHRYGYGAVKCHMSRPVSRSMTCDAAQIAGTNPTIRARSQQTAFRCRRQRCQAQAPTRRLLGRKLFS